MGILSCRQRPVALLCIALFFVGGGCVVLQIIGSNILFLPGGTVRLCFGGQFFGGQSTLLILLEPWLHRFRR